VRHARGANVLVSHAAILRTLADPGQATLALPMLCFPAVLFSGAIIPVHVMAGVGAAISALMADRRAFRDARTRPRHPPSPRPLAPRAAAAAGHGSAGSASTGVYWLYLGAFAVVFFAGAWVMLSWRCRRSTR
jgi:hypothetical protein